MGPERFRTAQTKIKPQRSKLAMLPGGYSSHVIHGELKRSDLSSPMSTYVIVNINSWFKAWADPNSPAISHKLPFGNLTQLWKITIFNGKTHDKSPFLIAMLNYQRVSYLNSSLIFNENNFSFVISAGGVDLRQRERSEATPRRVSPGRGNCYTKWVSQGGPLRSIKQFVISTYIYHISTIKPSEIGAPPWGVDTMDSALGVINAPAEQADFTKPGRFRCR